MRKGHAHSSLARRASSSASGGTPRNNPHRGFSLLEVILAAAILAGAIAILGEAARHAMRNAEAARDLARAQLLCEGKLAEIVAGLTPAEAVQNAPLETPLDPSEPDWVYSVETQPLDQEGLTAVRVTVSRDVPAEQRPIEFSLVRWLITSEPTTMDSTTPSEPSTSTGSSSTGGGL